MSWSREDAAQAYGHLQTPEETMQAINRILSLVLACFDLFNLTFFQNLGWSGNGKNTVMVLCLAD